MTCIVNSCTITLMGDVNPVLAPSDELTTIEVARLLGMAVRSVQLMVDRGELRAWKTPGGHRRIARDSVEQWIQRRRAAVSGVAPGKPARSKPCVLLIEDSGHYQKLVRMLFEQQFPQLSLEVADDGIGGLAMAGRLQPEILLVDLLLPGIDGATLISSLRSHSAFTSSQLIVVTSLEESQREVYSQALQGLPVVCKPRLAAELPGLLQQALVRLADG